MTTKFSLWVAQSLPHKSKMVDDRHLEKNQLLYLSKNSTFSTKFCTLTHIGPPNPKRCLKKQIYTRSSAIAEGLRDALVSRNSATTKDPI